MGRNIISLEQFYCHRSLLRRSRKPRIIPLLGIQKGRRSNDTIRHDQTKSSLLILSRKFLLWRNHVSVILLSRNLLPSRPRQDSNHQRSEFTPRHNHSSTLRSPIRCSSRPRRILPPIQHLQRNSQLDWKRSHLNLHPNNKHRTMGRLSNHPRHRSRIRNADARRRYHQRLKPSRNSRRHGAHHLRAAIRRVAVVSCCCYNL